MTQVLYKGRKRTVHLGKSGGKYVIVQGTKRYLRRKTAASKKKKVPKRKPTKKKVVKRKTFMNYFKMSGGDTVTCRQAGCSRQRDRNDAGFVTSCICGNASYTDRYWENKP